MITLSRDKIKKGKDLCVGKRQREREKKILDVSTVVKTQIPERPTAARASAPETAAQSIAGNTAIPSTLRGLLICIALEWKSNVKVEQPNWVRACRVVNTTSNRQMI